jgi:DUF2075 family protein
MLLYQGTSIEFVEDNARNRIVDKLQASYADQFHQPAQASEIKSWQYSLAAISQVVKRAHLLEHGILLEYQLPLTSKRLDCLICGRDAAQQANAIIIELKQWQTTYTADGENEVCTLLGGERKEVLHPAAQVGQYRNYLRDVHSDFTGDSAVHLYACAYLHNYTYQSEDPLLDNKFEELTTEFPIFSRPDENLLIKYLQEKLALGDGLPTLEKITSGGYLPAKKLMVEVSDIVRSKSTYTLLDNQLIIYDKVKELVLKAESSQRKTAVIVKGGPGTGKSVIALHLLTNLLNEGKTANYATGSKAFTETLWRVFGNRSRTVFKYFNNYGEVAPGIIDVLICDEAHRIRLTSNHFRTPAAKRSTLPQLYELLRASKVTVLFIDDFQIVRPGEIGSIQYVRDYALSKNVDVLEYTLSAQFRCNGSDGFVNWLDNTLAIRPTANVTWSKSDQDTFDFQVFDTPDSLESAIRDKVSEGHTGRLTAGFCWPWSKPDAQGNLLDDVSIGSFKRPWNAHHEATQLATGIPKASLWAYESGGINQVGCVYTAQGFEFDYVGVIVGKDFVFDLTLQQWKAYPEHSFDSTVKRDRARFLEYVKNSYKVLLTRGMKGCFVYFVDDNTKHHFQSLIQ